MCLAHGRVWDVSCCPSLCTLYLHSFSSEKNKTVITRQARTVCENTEEPRHCLAGSWPLRTCPLHDRVTHENDGSWKTGSTNLEQLKESASGLKLFTKQWHCAIDAIPKY